MQNILIIEDDPDINILLATILGKSGYEVDSAFSGTEGELRIQLKHYDLILCDLMLPGLSGEELIKKVRRGHTVPIIALTAKDALEDKVNVFELGVDDYITKPFEQEELLVRIKARLRHPPMLENDTKSAAVVKGVEGGNKGSDNGEGIFKGKFV